MKVDRRALLGALGLSVAAGAAGAQETQAPPATTPPAQASLADRITQRATENRHRLAFDGTRFSGPAYDLLLQEGRAAQFFCIGEEHGIAENPKLAAQLFAELQYDKACVEISAPMAAELDRAARGGAAGLRQLFSDPGAQVAFFGMREEAEWLAAVRAARPGRAQAIWGLDYEVGGDRRLIQILKTKRKPTSAATALAALEAASAASWAQYAETRGPQYIFSFSGDPTLVAAVRTAWPNADAEARSILTTLEETLAINQLWVQRRGWESNQRRAELNRANLRRYWAAEGERNPKVMFKFGASHVVRGLSHTQVLDIGTHVSEHAALMGAKSFHIAVFPGASSQVAQFDPTSWTYRPSEAGTYAEEGMTPLMAAAYPDGYTLIDLRPIRSLVFGARHKALDADLVRTIHGFDALLVLTGATASANL
ncbi:MAG: hypothetical protein R3C30_05565 [Hyphomonadaceae bacterium]